MNTISKTGSLTPGRFCYSYITTHSQQGAVTDELLKELWHNHPPDQTDRVHGNKRKVTRQGKKKGGIKARFKREEVKHQSPSSVVLVNMSPASNKHDRLQANVFHMYELPVCFHPCFYRDVVWGGWQQWHSTYRWIHISCKAIDTQLTGKHHSGGVCLDINLRWCKTTLSTVSTCLCSSLFFLK